MGCRSPSLYAWIGSAVERFRSWNGLRTFRDLLRKDWDITERSSAGTGVSAGSTSAPGGRVLDPWRMLPLDLSAVIRETVPVNSKRNGLALVLAYTAIVHVPITTLTWRDLRYRPATQVRGNKKVWQIASAVNTTGSVAYWLFGRRRSLA